MSVAADGTIPELVIDLAYEPSPEAWQFHWSSARFRHLLWGVKGGKTKAGAIEFLRWAGGLPGTLSWGVAPTFLNLEEAEDEVVNILDELHIKYRRRRSQHEYWLPNGSKIRFKSGADPDNLRGPNVTGILWVDEFAVLLAAAWVVLRSRISASMAGMVTSSTPKGRNWTWPHYVRAGLPPDAAYGEFQSEDGQRWVSHRPTWHFRWVPKREIEDAEMDMPSDEFQQEYGAMFVTSASKVFDPYPALSRIKIPKKITGSTTMGLDLAKQQDFTAVVVMDPSRRVLHVDRWTKVNWRVQRPRIMERAKRWNATVVIDLANVGSVISEDLTAAGASVVEVNLNSALVKRAMIEGLQISFEHGQITIPDPDAPWVPSIFKTLVDELDLFEAKLTPGKKIGYGAPKGLHDDLAIAMALANYGISTGAAGGVPPDDVSILRSEFGMLPVEDEDEEDDFQAGGSFPKKPRLKTPRIIRDQYRRRRRSALGLEDDGGPLFNR